MGEIFRERERQFEAKFAREEEMMFRVRARRARLFASWASEQLGEEGPPDYAETLVGFAFGRRAEELIGKVVRDLHDHRVAFTDTKIKRGFEMCNARAREEVMNSG